MGNTLVVTNGDRENGQLATVAVSKYLKLTKSKIISIRNTLAEHATRRDHKVGRPVFQMALDRAAVRKYPDQQVLHHLFTMWATKNIHHHHHHHRNAAAEDNNNNCTSSKTTTTKFKSSKGGSCVVEQHKVNYYEFIIGLSPLACSGECLTSVLRFAMRVMDSRKGGENTSNKMMNANQLIFMLKNVNLLLTCFGDETLCQRQIHKIVDDVFDTITMISDSDTQDLLSHEEIIDQLVEAPLIQKVAYNKLRISSSRNGGGHIRRKSTSPVSEQIIEQLYTNLQCNQDGHQNTKADAAKHNHHRRVQISATASDNNKRKKNNISHTTRFSPSISRKSNSKSKNKVNWCDNNNCDEVAGAEEDIVVGRTTRLVYEEDVSQISSVMLSPLPVLHYNDDENESTAGLISL